MAQSDARTSPHIQAIRERLSHLLEDRSQSELARATHTSTTNVHYYLQGRRIPADFCAELVVELGVNPTWMLTGEGPPYLSQLQAEQSDKAGDLLELVDSMNAISRMRLGALAGKDQLKIFRKLNESLVMHRNLREDLSAQATPLLKELIDKLSKAMTDYELPTAKRLSESAHQVVEFCDDPELQALLTRTSAALEMLLGNTDRAIEINRGLFTQIFAVDGKITPELLEHTFLFIDSLRVARRGFEAKRVATATLALCEELRDESAYQRIAIISGLLSLDLGDFAQANHLMRSAYGRLEGWLFDAFRPAMDVLDLHGGIITLEQVCKRFGDETDQAHKRARVVYAHVPLFWACWLESREELELAIDGFATLAEKQERAVGSIFSAHAQGLLKLISTKKRGRSKLHIEDESFVALFDERDPHNQALYPVLAAQAHRIAGNRQRAFELTLHAESIFKQDEGVILNHFFVRMMHQRNALELSKMNPEHAQTGRLAIQARAFFVEHLDKGYGCLRDVVRMLP